MSKATKKVAREVDEELLHDQALVNKIMQDEKDQVLPDLSIDEWNEIYLDLQSEFNNMLAKQLIEDRKQDAGADFELN